ncbi:hypothetical protein Tco_0799743 [Tanacetum coccineum]|uniref:Uncharacterized protein n=1 Tax=Tanacetum coccineum TaxID=301880 RepID=A0ABQ4ZR61_9ASTR
MIALDRQRVRAQIGHSLHHYWLLEGVLSGFNLGGEEFGVMAISPPESYMLYCRDSPYIGNGERSGPTGFQLAREHLQSRVKEEDLITDVENAIFDL